MEEGGNIRQALSSAIEELEGAGVPDAVVEAERMLCRILKCKRHELFLNPEKSITTEEHGRIKAFMARRKRREPAAYITGETEFRDLRLKVTRAVLIPRPETELLVERALKFLEGIKEPVIIDLCTGSGCIAVTLAVELLRKGAAPLIYATDISGAALDVARDNAIANNVDKRVKFIEGDLFGPLGGLGLKGKADLIISNPPYVSTKEKESLESEVRAFEPPAALYGGVDGLLFIRRIIKGGPEYLRPGGVLLMEIGWSQGEAVKGLASKDPALIGATVKKDFSGMDRIFEATKKTGR
ncbi:MAG: peptide chain release factor N(5)-glutamine methyltransferase [Thermodesulfobacteriota bacterium]